MKIDYSTEYQGCFVCGKENSRGLKLDFFFDHKKNEVYTNVVFEEYMQGYNGIIHGGFITMLLDEVMAKACLFADLPAVTAKLEVQFKRPAKIAEHLRFVGKLVERHGKRIKTEAECLNDSQELKAKAKALFVMVEVK